MKNIKFAIACFLFGVTASSFAQTAGDNDKIAHTMFNKLLDVSPDRADEYIQLEQDIARFNLLLVKAKSNHASNIQQFSQHQISKDNEYNRNDKFITFRQLDNQQHKKLIAQSSYELQRIRSKLHQASNSYQVLQNKIDSLYIAKYAVVDSKLISALESGKVVVVAEHQKRRVIDHLISLKGYPQQLVNLLSHDSVAMLLPDYLKEQLKVFEESNISLVSALANRQVIDAVIDKLEAIEVLSEHQVMEIAASVYEIKEGSSLLSQGSYPISMSNYVGTGAISPLKAIELYDIPIPSEELVNQISSLGGGQPKRLITPSALIK